jgi:hypothetical protein
MTWMTPFDWKTSAVVTVALPSALWWGVGTNRRRDCGCCEAGVLRSGR